MEVLVGLVVRLWVLMSPGVQADGLQIFAACPPSFFPWRGSGQGRAGKGREGGVQPSSLIWHFPESREGPAAIHDLRDCHMFRDVGTPAQARPAVDASILANAAEHRAE